MIYELEPVLFMLFVFFIVWMTWVPLNYTLKNLKRLDFDFYRDIAFYFDAVKARYNKPLGKIGSFYIAFYIFFSSFKYFVKK